MVVTQQKVCRQPVVTNHCYHLTYQLFLSNTTVNKAYFLRYLPKSLLIAKVHSQPVAFSEISNITIHCVPILNLFSMISTIKSGEELTTSNIFLNRSHCFSIWQHNFLKFLNGNHRQQEKSLILHLNNIFSRHLKKSEQSKVWKLFIFGLLKFGENP